MALQPFNDTMLTLWIYEMLGNFLKFCGYRCGRSVAAILDFSAGDPKGGFFAIKLVLDHLDTSIIPQNSSFSKLNTVGPFQDVKK